MNTIVLKEYWIQLREVNIFDSKYEQETLVSF